MGERLEQRLGLRDLRKLRRRRKALQRRPQNIVGLGRAVRRLVQLGQRQRGAQPEAASLLLPRDCDGGEENGFGVGGVGGVCLMRISPRMRWSPASNQCSPVSPTSAGASSITPSAAWRLPLGFDLRKQPLISGCQSGRFYYRPAEGVTGGLSRVALTASIASSRVRCGKRRRGPIHDTVRLETRAAMGTYGMTSCRSPWVATAAPRPLARVLLNLKVPDSANGD